MKRVVAIGVLILALAPTGCGTVANFRNGVENATPYGGVEIAVERFKPGQKNCAAPTALAWPVYAVDVAGSAVADTLTLPITVPLGVVRAVNDSINAYYFPPEKPSEAQNAWRQFWFNDRPESDIPATPPVK
jgi:uncharacterized protein YceK